MTNPGPKPAVPIGDRWAQDEQILAEHPRTPTVMPRWMEDDLPQYAPDGPAQPTFDHLSGDDL